MSTKQNEPNHQASQASATNQPTVRKEIGSCDANEALQWIQPKLSLKPKDVKRFEEAEINGRVFLRHAGDLDFFTKAGFSYGVSDDLAELAREASAGKSIALTSWTSRRQPAYIVVGSSEQAGMTDSSNNTSNKRLKETYERSHEQRHSILHADRNLSNIPRFGQFKPIDKCSNCDGTRPPAYSDIGDSEKAQGKY
jgi:hypothetical protein